MVSNVKSSHGGGRRVGQEWVRERGTQERQKTGGGATQTHRTREPHQEGQGRAQQTRRRAVCATGRPAMRGKRAYGGRPGQRVEEQGTWAPRTQKHSEAGYGRPVDRGAWTAKTVKRPRQQPAHPQYANYWAPLSRKRHTMPHSAQPEHTNYCQPQRPTESSNPTQHAKGRTGDCPVKEHQPDGMSHRGDRGVETFPIKLFCAVRGISCSLCILSGGGASFIMESQPGPCSSSFISDLMSWYCSKFGPPKVSHNRLSTRNQRLGVSQFPMSDGPAPKRAVCRKFPLMKLFPDQTKSPPPCIVSPCLVHHLVICGCLGCASRVPLWGGGGGLLFWSLVEVAPLSAHFSHCHRHPHADVFLCDRHMHRRLRICFSFMVFLAYSLNHTHAESRVSIGDVFTCVFPLRLVNLRVGMGKTCR